MTGMPYDLNANALPSMHGSARPADSSTLFGSLHLEQHKTHPGTTTAFEENAPIPPWLAAVCDGCNFADSPPTAQPISGSSSSHLETIPRTSAPHAVSGHFDRFAPHGGGKGVNGASYDSQSGVVNQWEQRFSAASALQPANHLAHQDPRQLELLPTHTELPVHFEDALTQHRPPVVTSAADHFLPVVCRDFPEFQPQTHNLLIHAPSRPVQDSTPQLSHTSMANSLTGATRPPAASSCHLGHRTGSAPALMNLTASQPTAAPTTQALPLSRASSDFHGLNLAQGLLTGQIAPALPRKSKRWWEILQALHHFPKDTGLAICSVIRDAIRAAHVEGVEASITSLLQLAISEFEEGRSCENMRNTALEVLRRFKPADNIDDPLSLAFSAALPSLRPSKATASARCPAPATTRRPGQGQETLMVRHTERGEAQFHANVAALKHKPWFELIDDIKKMKPNNGYPIKVNIAAAMLSAQTHPIHRDARVPLLLQQAMAVYARKSCGMTKQKALATLELTRHPGGL